VYNLKGNVKLQITPVGVGTPVLSGLFFGPGGKSSSPAPSGASASAVYTGLDTVTQGTWTGKYGSGGYSIANGNSSQPYASLGFSGNITYTWAGLTADVRALQNAPGSAGRIASSYTAQGMNSFVVNVNITDGAIHPVALYMVDWDGTTRAQNVTISDASTNAVLDTESFSGFSNGQYGVWNIQGNVNITVTPTGTGAAVVSGIFLGPGNAVSTAPTSPPATPYFSGLDSTTQGAWNGKYGGEGYVLANGASASPAYASVGFTGALSYTWAGLTSDVRALQNGAGSSSGIAAAYVQYPGNSFTVNLNFTDGLTHRVALYLLDWDTTTRAETVTVLDGASNSVLDTQTFSGFHNGQYAVYNLKGNVKLQITPVGGGTPVLSGIFFGY
jgi:hypothetical protein